MTDTTKGIYVIDHSNGDIAYWLKAADAADHIRREPGATMRFIPDGGHIHHNGHAAPSVSP